MKMKVKNYFIILAVLFILLFYNLFAYKFANNRIEEHTKYAITNYFKSLNVNNLDYEYIKATLNENATINVFIKYNNKYYRFIFENNGGYKLLNVNVDIPVYIK